MATRIAWIGCGLLGVAFIVLGLLGVAFIVLGLLAVIFGDEGGPDVLLAFIGMLFGVAVAALEQLRTVARAFTKSPIVRNYRTLAPV